MSTFLKAYHYQVYFGLLLLTSALLPTAELLGVKALSFSLMLITFWFLLNGNWQQKWHRIRSNRLLWLFSALYLVNVISFFWSDDVDYAASLLVRKLPLLVLPVVVAASPTLSKKHVHYILIVFVTSLFLVSLTVFREGLTVLLNRHDLTDLVRLVPLHRPYLGMYCGFAILALLYFTSQTKRKALMALAVALCLYFGLYIFLIFSKMVVIVLGFILLITSLLYIRKRIGWPAALGALALLLVGAGITLSTNKQLVTAYHKIIAFEDFDYKEYDIQLVSSINIRYINWGCSMAILQKDNNWLTGLGLGNTQEQLQKCYKDRNPWIYEQQQNAHNEYFEEMLRNGIGGLLILALCFAVPLALCLHKYNYLYLSFILLFSLCCITESLLSRQAGIAFYALFNALFAFNFLQVPMFVAGKNPESRNQLN